MAVHKPRKPRRPTSRASLTKIPNSEIFGMPGQRGEGTQFVDQLLTKSRQSRPIDMGHGLPQARPPQIARTTEEVAMRAREKRLANTRRSGANNVRGYVPSRQFTPYPFTGPLPSAQDLLESDRTMPTAAQLLVESGGMVTDRDDEFITQQLMAQGRLEVLPSGYLFPQVAPTKTTDPMRPRTLEAGYEPNTHGRGLGTLRIRFRDGPVYGYYEVPPNVWRNFKRVISPGRFVNRVLNDFSYAQEYL